MTSTPGWRLAQIAISGAALVLAHPAGAEPDVLDRPALMSPRAASSVLLAMTKAGKRIIAAGERGIILLSDDNGARWRQAKVPVSVSITNVRFATATKGWAVGHSGVVLHSNDGGETWVKQLDGKLAAQLMLDAAKSGDASDGKDVQRVRAEAERAVAEGPDKPFFDLYFSDENNGLIVGAFGLAFATQDGGRSWRPAMNRFDNPKGKHMYCIFVEGNDYFIAGEQGAVFRSLDGGKSFSELKSPYAGTLFGVLTAASGAPVVFGLRGKAYWSSDAGTTWHSSETGTPNTLTAALRRSDGSLVLVDETGRVLESRDAGRSFKPMAIPQPSPYTGVVQANDDSLILSGVRGITRLPININSAEPKQ